MHMLLTQVRVAAGQGKIGQSDKMSKEELTEITFLTLPVPDRAIYFLLLYRHILVYPEMKISIAFNSDSRLRYM